MWKQDHPGEIQHHRISTGTRGEIVIRPPEDGTFNLEILSVDDRHYRGIKVVGTNSITTTVHPLASARFLHTETPECKGNQVKIGMDLKVGTLLASRKQLLHFCVQGVAPWTFEYETLVGTTRKKFTVKNIQDKDFTLIVPIPSAIAQTGGKFIVSPG